MCPPIVDGQSVSAAVTNPAFIDAVDDDTAQGKITFANVDAVSGSTVTNIQREVNSLNSATGRPSGSVYNYLPTFTNSQGFTATQDIIARIEALSALFHNSTGHAHDGTSGKGAPVTGASITSVPLRGSVIQGTDLTGVTGTSTNVTTQLTGETPSTSSTIQGVVVNAPQNKVIIRQATGANQNDVFKNGSGDVVYARVSESSGVWTLSYFVDISGTETPYSFSSSDVRWYYQKLFAPLVNAPVYSEFATIPSDNVTQDVVDATTSQKGKSQLATSAASVGSSNAAGTANATVANADHVHQGIHSVKEFVDNTEVYGDIILKGDTGTSITRSGQTFTVSSSTVTVTSVFGRTGAVVAVSGDYTKADVGLGNVDNTSDLNKPVSTAQNTAFAGGVALANAATATNTASTIVRRDANSNADINNLARGLATTATAAGTTTLTVASAYNQRFTGVTTQTVVMPDATTLSVGHTFTVLNRSTGAITVNANGGGLLGTVLGGSQAIFTVVTNVSSAGTWDVASSASGASLTPIKETPTGTVNGVNTAFTLSQTPANAAYLNVYLDGIFETAYSLGGTTVTFSTAPALGQSVYVTYLY